MLLNPGVELLITTGFAVIPAGNGDVSKVPAELYIYILYSVITAPQLSGTFQRKTP